MSISYLKSWILLESSTPLETDCGSLCRNACCRGSNDEGMLLFPDEELMYRENEDWFEIKDSNITLSDGSNIKLFVCKGNCERSMRPLSCRIFPVIPYIDDYDYLNFVPDLRGAAICPLLNKSDGGIAPAFIDALFSAFEGLIEHDKVLEFIHFLSSQNDELADVYKRLL